MWFCGAGWHPAAGWQPALFAGPLPSPIGVEVPAVWPNQSGAALGRFRVQVSQQVDVTGTGFIAGNLHSGSFRVGDPPGAVGSPIIAGVFLPDCWMEGLLPAGIGKRWAAFDGESGRAPGVR